MLLRILSLFSAVAICIHAEDPIVQINNGKIKGEVMLSTNNRTYYAFRGVPFAKPPLGDLRFKPPQRADNWEGILDSDAKERKCIQISSKLEPNESEDCLYVHVYTPQLPSDAANVSLPVMYAIHGGAFVSGTPDSTQLGPEYLMDYDVVVVSVGYRLGFLGFLSTADLNCPGNNGLKDQQFGLRWVQENIRQFGGDPSRVTIFGESAGGASVGFQILGSNAEGLFIGAIQDSGTPMGNWAIQRNPRGIAYTFANHINSSINENNTSTLELLDYFRTLDVQTIKTACVEVFGDGFIGGFYQTLWGFVFSGTIEPEHEGAFLTEAPYQKFVKGNFNKVPNLIGLNSEECLFLSLDEGLQKRMAYSDENTENFVLPDMHITDLETKKVVGKKIREIYSPNPINQNEALCLRFFSENAFDRPISKQAELESKYIDVYFYEFAYSGELGRSADNPDVPGAGKVAHGEDMRYLFHSFGSKELNSVPKKDIVTMQRLLTLWTNFVKYQNPTPKPIELLDGQIWPKIESVENVPYFFINETLEVRYNYNKRALKEYQKLYDTYAVPPLDTY